MSFLLPDSLIIDAIESVNDSPEKIAVVLNDSYKLLGTITDGDIRRCFLNGGGFETSVLDAMNKNPIFADIDSSADELSELMSHYGVKAIPLINSEKKFVRTVDQKAIYRVKKDNESDPTFVAAVIMAGGEGIRLRPHTSDKPKPMVMINGLPILERQIRKLKALNIKKIFISVNYLKDVIIDYFKDGIELGVEINYLEEKKKLGTAGSLSLLPEINSGSILVMNGDVLTSSDFRNLYNFHKNHSASITISAIEYRVNIPYGVIERKGYEFIQIKEKPSQSFFCNAGIYAISADTLNKIPANEYWDMTDLIKKCKDDNESVSIFPIHEYWSDIGTSEDLEKARMEFKEKNEF